MLEAQRSSGSGSKQRCVTAAVEPVRDGKPTVTRPAQNASASSVSEADLCGKRVEIEGFGLASWQHAQGQLHQA